MVNKVKRGRREPWATGVKGPEYLVIISVIGKWEEWLYT